MRSSSGLITIVVMTLFDLLLNLLVDKIFRRNPNTSVLPVATCSVILSFVLVVTKWRRMYAAIFCRSTFLERYLVVVVIGRADGRTEALLEPAKYPRNVKR